MDNRKQNFQLVLSAVSVIAIVALIVMQAFGGGPQSLFTPQAVGYPKVYLEGGNKLIIQEGGAIIATPGATVNLIGASGAFSGNNIVTGHLKVLGPTAAVTATPVARIDNAADANDLLSIEKDASAVFQIHNSGAVERTGSDTLTGAFVQTGNVVQTAPTAALTATPGWYQNNAADVNDAFVIAKDGTAEFIVGNAGTLNMTSNAISNIGAAGTDFSATGGLTLADDLDMSAQPIVNVGNAGTDFDTSGGLTLAAGLVVGTKEQLSCTYVEEPDNTNENLTVAASCYIVSVTTAKNADYALQTTNAVTGTLLTITQIGAGTLVITDTNLISSDGNAISLGANDSALFLFDGSKWNGLLKLAGS
jgi:hypothetical protein